MEKTLSRREVRTHLFRLLFEVEFHHTEEMEDQLQHYFSLHEMEEDAQTELRTKLAGIQEHLSEIDTLLNETSKGWKTSRMNKVDLSLLRLAVYEILYCPDVPNSVAINEAVEIAKKFSSKEASSFVNGILAAIVKKVEAQDTESPS